MSWHFSLALEAAFLQGICSDGGVCVPLNGIPTAPDDSCSGKMKATSHRSPFGTMYVPSTDTLGEDILMWFREDFLARTSAQREILPESKGMQADSGERWPGLLGKYDHTTHSLKTPQISLITGLNESCATLPPSGWMHDGCVYQQPIWVHRINAPESGLWPTPSGVKGRGHCAGVISEWGGSANPFRGTELRNLHLPTLEEMMLDWPEGWSAPTQLETDKFQSWLQQHGESSVSNP